MLKIHNLMDLAPIGLPKKRNLMEISMGTSFASRQNVLSKVDASDPAVGTQGAGRRLGSNATSFFVFLFFSNGAIVILRSDFFEFRLQN